MRRIHRLQFPLLALALASTTLGCGDSDSGSSAKQSAVVTQYASLVRASYDDAIDTAKALQTAVKKLVDDPSQKTLDAARDAWKAARVPYLQTEAYRFYDGPIDQPTDTPIEGQLNAWPLDERAIDYVVSIADDGSEQIIADGIINNPDDYPEITAEVLIDENAVAAETIVLLGYHAIEFLLWGQDRNDDGPGDRPYTDYVASDDGAGVDAERRATYLTVVTNQLVEDLQTVRDAWDEDANYAKQFADAPQDSLALILKGIFSLVNTELAGDRTRAPYSSQDQEDEHSCFSDNTDNDFKYDLVGLENVYYGRYGELSGASVHDLVNTADADLDATIIEQLDAASAAVAAIPAPFDQAIQDAAGRKKLKAAIDAFDLLKASLAQLPKILGVE